MNTAPAITTGGIPARADPYTNTDSIEFRFRARRFALVQGIIQKVLDRKGSCEIIDLGGTETYWRIGKDFVRKNRGRLHFTVVNTERETIRDGALFSFVHGSATDARLFEGRSFDLAHSNSVIEHVGVWSDMQDFAANTRRLAPRYYVQTPNYWFPYEPHFRTPAFQYLPERVRVALIMRFSLGFFRRIDDRAEAEDIIYYHRLLSTRQMERLFPDAVVTHEKFKVLNKSVIAIRDMDG
jgi:hypothetical protein